MSPVAALRVPDRLVGRWKIAPAHLPGARFVICRYRLPHHLAHSSGIRIGNAKLLLLVIARGRNKRNVLTVGTPLHIVPLRASADEVIAERTTMLVRRHLQANDAR